jgi:hypothetical protein
MSTVMSEANTTEGNVEILSKVNCGFCMTGHHTSCCIRTSPYYNKIWICPCDCDKSLVVKPKPVKDWWSKYRSPFKKVESGTTKSRKKTATNIPYTPSTTTHVPYVPPKPRDKRVDALAAEMLEDVRAHEDFQKEKEKWEA